MTSMISKLKQIMPLPLKRLIQKSMVVLKKNVHGFLSHFKVSRIPGYQPTFLTAPKYNEKIIFPPKTYSHKAPDFLQDKLSKQPYPIEQDAMQCDNIVVYGKLGYIKKDRQFILDHLIHPEHFYAAQDLIYVMWSNPWFIKKPKISLDKAIIIVSLFSHNYYHYLMDTLTKFSQNIDHQEILDIIMIEPSLSFQKESMHFIDSKYRLHYVSNQQSIHVKNAWIPLAKYHPEYPPLHKINYLRKFFTHETSVKSPKRVYISRKTARNERKIINENALIECLKNYDFDVVDFTNKPLYYQHSILKETEIIVSPHGAGLTNILFSNHRPTLIEMFHKNDPCTHYFNIASHLNMPYELYIDESFSRLSRPNINVDLTRFEQQLKNVINKATL